MLLYHFPLTSSFENKGFLNENFVVNQNSSIDSTYGKLASKSMKVQSETYGGIVIPFASTNMTELSICFRFYLTTRHDWRSIVSIDGTKYIDIAYADFNMFWYGNGHVLAKNVQNKWNDLVMNFANDNLSFYLNGEKVYDYSLPIALDQYITSYITVGARKKGPYDTNSVSDAFYQDIRIYDYALSQAEINEYSRALVVHYPLQGNELNPSVLKDVSGFGNDAIQSDGSYVTDSPRALDSLSFNGISTYADRASIDKANTVSFWIKPKQLSTSQVIYADANSDICFTILSNSRGINTKLRANTYPEDSISYNEWNHIVIVKGSTNNDLYVNGIKKTESSSYETLGHNNNVLYLGCRYYGSTKGLYYSGNISDVRIYATALSAEDIKNLYNSPISVSKQHQTMAFEFKENSLYPSKYWRTPTYAEMNYILNTRTNAANLRTLGRVEISSGVYRNGLFLLPDGFTAPSGITVTITTANYTTNSYTLAQFKQLESVGVVFLPECMLRSGTNMLDNRGEYKLGTYLYRLRSKQVVIDLYASRYNGDAVRLIHNGTHFSTSATTKIDFAPANLQYHCTQHIWRFAEHSYHIIGADNANISDSYNGWIDLFGYGTSGVNYSPTLHTTTNSDYASGDIANTDNDWGVNEIQSYDYNVKNFAANKNGIVQHNELRENDSDVNGCYQDKLITNELIEN